MTGFALKIESPKGAHLPVFRPAFSAPKMMLRGLRNTRFSHQNSPRKCWAGVPFGEPFDLTLSRVFPFYGRDPALLQKVQAGGPRVQKVT